MGEVAGNGEVVGARWGGGGGGHQLDRRPGGNGHSDIVL